MNWFQSIWQWFVDNKDTIFGWLTSANVTGLLTAVLVFVKQHKSIIANTTSTNDLKNAMKEYEKFTDKLNSTFTTVQNIVGELKEFKQSVADNINIQDTIVSKLDAVLNVQQLAYSKLKNEDTRDAIDNIIINAKYKEQGTRAELINEITKLKENSEKLSLEYQKLVENTSAKLQDIAEPAKEHKETKKKTSVSRY